MKRTNDLFWQRGLLLVVLGCLLSAYGSATSNNQAPTGNTIVIVPTKSAPTSTGTQAVSTTTSQATILPTRPLTHIRMTDAMHGWALDQDNVLKTSDGGKSWVDSVGKTIRTRKRVLVCVIINVATQLIASIN